MIFKNHTLYIRWIIEADRARLAALEDVEKEIEAGKCGELATKDHAKMTLKELGDGFITIRETSWSKQTNRYMRTNLGKCKDYYDRTWESISILGISALD